MQPLQLPAHALPSCTYNHSLHPLLLLLLQAAGAGATRLLIPLGLTSLGASAFLDFVAEGSPSRGTPRMSFTSPMSPHCLLRSGVGAAGGPPVPAALLGTVGSREQRRMGQRSAPRCVPSPDDASKVRAALHRRL